MVTIKPIAVEYKGVQYRSYKKLCEAHDVNYNVFMRRKKERPELGVEKWLKGYTYIEYEGVGYSSYNELCNHLGIHHSVLYERRKANPNGTVEDWIQPRFTIEYDGKTFKNSTELCKYYNVSREKYYSNKSRYPEQSVGFWLGLDKRSVSEMALILCKGNRFRTQKDLCDYYGIDYNYFLLRRAQNSEATIESLVDRVLLEGKVDLRAVSITHNGVTYPSYKDFCEKNNLDYMRFMKAKKEHKLKGVGVWIEKSQKQSTK